MSDLNRIAQNWYGGTPQPQPDWAKAFVDRYIDQHLAEHGEIRWGAIIIKRPAAAQSVASRWYGEQK